MGSFDFLVTAISFSLLGYSLCYLTLSTSFKKHDEEQSSFPNSETFGIMD